MAMEDPYPWEDQCEWHRRTRMAGPDCAIICNLINSTVVRNLRKK